MSDGPRPGEDLGNGDVWMNSSPGSMIPDCWNMYGPDPEKNLFRRVWNWVYDALGEEFGYSFKKEN